MIPLVIVENGVRLRLNIVDTPGYGDQVNNENWYVFSAHAVAITSCGSNQSLLTMVNTVGTQSLNTSKTSIARTFAKS